MRLFIHQENQTLLWNLIQQSPHWEEFSALYKGHTNLWFKNIISNFYDKYWDLYGQKMSVEDLKRVNREVMAAMILDIRRSIAPPKAAPSPQSRAQLPPPSTPTIRENEIPYDRELNQRVLQYDTPSPATYPFMSQPTVAASPSPTSESKIDQTNLSQLQQSYDVQKEKEAKMEKAKKEFDEFQRRYTAGFERKPPPPIDFSIKLDQDRIGNMDELVKRQLAEREKDLEGVSMANIQ